MALTAQVLQVLDGIVVAMREYDLQEPYRDDVIQFFDEMAQLLCATVAFLALTSEDTIFGCCSNSSTSATAGN